MSAKNRLQEIFQGLGTRLPEYTFYREGGEDHCPKWRCKVNTKHGKDNITFSSECCISKKEASKQAALKAWQWYGRGYTTDISSDYKLDNDETAHTFVLLDLENAPHSYRDFCKSILFEDESRVSVIGFFSHASGHIRGKILQDMKDHDRKLHLAEVKSSRSDAADIGMCLWVGKMMSQLQCDIRTCKDLGNWHPTFCLDLTSETKLSMSFGIASTPTVRIIVITKDHFGKALVELVDDTTHPQVSWKAQCYYSIDEIME